MDDAREITWGRTVCGLALGHFGAAYSFSATALLMAALFDPAVARPRTLDACWAFLRGLAWAPFMAAMLSIPVFFMMLPASLLTAPFTCFAARRLQNGIATALAVGAAIGAAEVAALMAWDGGFRGPWSHVGLPGDPRSDMLIVVCGAAAGTAYAGVIWRLCVRLRLPPVPLSPGERRTDITLRVR